MPPAFERFFLQSNKWKKAAYLSAKLGDTIAESLWPSGVQGFFSRFFMFQGFLFKVFTRFFQRFKGFFTVQGSYKGFGFIRKFHLKLIL